MATRRSIAEQVLRIINGGELNEDSRIELRDVMPLVDQERDTLIKAQIMDSMYTKGTATSKNELEVLGQFLSTRILSVSKSPGATIPLFAELPDIISLPKDMAIQSVTSVPPSSVAMKQRRVLGVTVTTPLTSTSTPDVNLISLTNGPLKMDDNYIVSFKINTGDTYKKPKEHNISFNVNTKKFKNTIYSWQGLTQAISSSNDFKKFLKDFKLSYNTTLSPGTTASITLTGLYDFKISNLTINSADSDGSHGFVYTTIDADSLSQDQISDTSLEIIINDTPYTVDFSNEDWGDVLDSSGSATMNVEIAQQYLAKAFVLKNADKIAKEQNLLVSTEFTGSGDYLGTDGFGGFSVGSPIFIQEIEPKGGFSIDIYSPGVANAQLVTGTYVIGLIDGAPAVFGQLDIPGYYPGRFRKPIVFTRMPSSGAYNTLYNKAVKMSGRDYYYIDGRAILLYGKYNNEDIDSILVKYIASSASIGDTDPYPIPSDFVSMIIKNLVQIFGVMRQAREDMTNDNLK
tara:strand:+ start:1146 stop:2690 length:1545 start_codon:yes stop_codon:yes gene_type:complete